MKKKIYFLASKPYIAVTWSVAAVLLAATAVAAALINKLTFFPLLFTAAAFAASAYIAVSALLRRVEIKDGGLCVYTPKKRSLPLAGVKGVIASDAYCPEKGCNLIIVKTDGKKIVVRGTTVFIKSNTKPATERLAEKINGAVKG